MTVDRQVVARGFSLIELMVASVISLIIVASATSLAVGVMRANRSTEAQLTVANRLSLTHSFIEAVISSVGYGWQMQQNVGGTNKTGAWGRAHCGSTTGVCYDSTGSSPTVFPFEICRSNTASGTVCDPPAVGQADALRLLVPREDLIEAVRIVEGYSGSPWQLGDAAVLSSSCASVPATVNLTVLGITSTTWNAGDLLMIANRDHVNIVRLGSNFSADASDPPANRGPLQVELVTTSNLEYDDGAGSIPCNPRASLIGAQVFRVAQVILAVKNGQLQMKRSETAAEVTSTTNWLPLVSGINDLQVQIDIASFPRDGTTDTAKTCKCNSSNIITGTTFGTQCSLCTNGKRLNGNSAVDEVNRILGVYLAILASGDLRQNTAPQAWYGLFDNSATLIATDDKYRRAATFYVGLPNARTF